MESLLRWYALFPGKRKWRKFSTNSKVICVLYNVLRLFKIYLMISQSDSWATLNLQRENRYKNIQKLLEIVQKFISFDKYV